MAGEDPEVKDAADASRGAWYPRSKEAPPRPWESAPCPAHTLGIQRPWKQTVWTQAFTVQRRPAETDQGSHEAQTGFTLTL